MRHPDRHLIGNLRFTRNGSVWADFRLQPLAYGLRSDKEKWTVRHYHQALLRALPGESLLLGVTVESEPLEIVERMVAGIDLEAHPDWGSEVDATLDVLADYNLGDRVFWLSVPLSDKGTGLWQRWKTSAIADVRDTLALPRQGVPFEEVQRRIEQSDKIQSLIPAAFQARPVTPAEQVWLHAHAARRGLPTDPDQPNPVNQGMQLTEELMNPRPGSSLPSMMLDEGGQTDLSRKELAGWNPTDRKYVKVGASTGSATATSYQALLVLADTPAQGMSFPGNAEYLTYADHVGYDVDWAIRFHTIASDEVMAKNQRALRNLSEQYHQRDGELSYGVSDLDRAAEQLADYSHTLRADKLEVEVQATLIFAVGGDTAELCQNRAQHLQSYFADADIRLTAPLGGQTELWWAMVPGAPTTRLVREFAQITTSASYSSTVPVISDELGDQTGPLLAMNQTGGGRLRPVLHDPAGAAARNVSGSMVITGDLGSGKSVALKTIGSAIADRGGQLVIPDTTDMGEYEIWASELTDSVVVDAANPTVSFDPLRIFPGGKGSNAAAAFLIPLLSVKPTSQQGVLLGQVLSQQYLNEHSLNGMGELFTHLGTDCNKPGAEELHGLMGLFAQSSDIGRVVFDPDLPPANLNASAIVVRTHTLPLPDREEIYRQHLADEMTWEKRFARAYYALISAVARQVCFSNRRRFGAFLVDEASNLTTSPQAEKELTKFIRDGRKHNASAILGTQAIKDFGSDTLTALIPTRIAMRTSDKEKATQDLEWLGLDSSSEFLVNQLTKVFEKGLGFMRDADGRVGQIQVVPPAMADRRLAAMTTPPTLADLESDDVDHLHHDEAATTSSES